MLLVTWKVCSYLIKPGARAEVRILCTYFEVWKDAVKRTTRTIFNGTTLNNCCKPPPPLALIPVLEQIRILEELQLFNLVTGDLRHWFTAIPIVNPMIRNFFVVGMQYQGSQLLFQWNTIAMGWSWSPYLSMCFGFALMLHTGLLDIPFADTLPRMLTSKSGEKIVAVAFLLYDNILFAADTQERAQSFHDALHKSARTLNVELKYAHVFTMQDLTRRNWERKEPEAYSEACEHLGLELALNSERRFLWRHCQKNIIKWRAGIEKVIEESRKYPCRFASKLVQIIAYHKRTSLIDTLEEMSWLLEESSKIARVAHKNDWEAVYTFDEEIFKRIQAEYKIIFTNEHHRYQRTLGVKFRIKKSL